MSLEHAGCVAGLLWIYCTSVLAQHHSRGFRTFSCSCSWNYGWYQTEICQTHSPKAGWAGDCSRHDRNGLRIWFVNIRSVSSEPLAVSSQTQWLPSVTLLWEACVRPPACLFQMISFCCFRLLPHRFTFFYLLFLPAAHLRNPCPGGPQVCQLKVTLDYTLSPPP